jgi:predicted RNA-binding protein with PUA-like domain
MAQQHWIVKQEPQAYSWDSFVKERGTAWTGVRNFQARNNLHAMKTGDWALFYHSGTAKAVVGLAQVSREAYPDPTATEGDWLAVDLIPVQTLQRPVTLEAIKADAVLKEMTLVRQSRLSISPLSAAQFKRLLSLSETHLSL